MQNAMNALDKRQDACYKFARGLEPHEHGFFTMFCCPYASTGFELKVTASKKILAKLGQKTHVNSQIFSVSFGFHSIAQMNTKSEHGSQMLATWLTSFTVEYLNFQGAFFDNFVSRRFCWTSILLAKDFVLQKRVPL